MQTNLRVIQLLKIRNQVSSRTLRNYGLYFALMLFLTYHFARFKDDIGGILITVMVLTSLFCSERQFFPQVKNTMNSIHFLTTPSQQWEKWLAEFIHTFFIIPIIAMTPLLAAALIVKFFSTSASNLVISFDAIVFAMKIYCLLHPILFFGAIYFRHSVLIKTFGSVALLAIASAVFVATLTNIFPLIDYESLAIYHREILSVRMISHPALLSIALPCYFIFFWGMSYLSLLELES